MAVVGYSYYENTYQGTAILDDELFPKFVKKAMVTFNRATYGRVVEREKQYGMMVSDFFIPFNKEEMDSVRFAICAMCDVLANIEKAEQQAMAGNTDQANVKSRSSGGESISYETVKTAYSDAVADSQKIPYLLKNTLTENFDTSVFRYNPLFAGL